MDSMNSKYTYLVCEKSTSLKISPSIFFSQPFSWSRSVKVRFLSLYAPENSSPWGHIYPSRFGTSTPWLKIPFSPHLVSSSSSSSHVSVDKLPGRLVSPPIHFLRFSSALKKSLKKEKPHFGFYARDRPKINPSTRVPRHQFFFQEHRKTWRNRDWRPTFIKRDVCPPCIEFDGLIETSSIWTGIV